MKIALVSPFPDEPGHVIGGVAGAARYLADELVRLPDLEVCVVAPQGARGGKAEREDWGRLTVHRLPRRRPWAALPGTVYDVAAGRRQVEAFLEELAPDVVHFQGASFLAARCPRPSVLTIHGIAERDVLWDRRWGPSRGVRRLLLAATEGRGRGIARNVILISESARTFLPAAPRRRVWSIPNPIADSFFAVRRRPEPGRVLCCSRIRPLKNIVGLIEAFAAVSRRVPGCRLRLAGAADQAYLAACREAAGKRGVGGLVDFLGLLSVSQIQHELSRARCFALTSFQENAPLSIAEAQAAGVPVVAARVGGIPEMVAEGTAGFLVDPADHYSIEGALLAALRDEGLAARASARGRELALRRHMASAVARRTAEVYREIARG